MSISSRDYHHLPPGYRFKPTDHELLLCHLNHKIKHGVALIQEIRDVDLYKFDPQALTETYPPMGDKEWYFFTPRNRKHPNGFRPNRCVGSGFWKPVSKDAGVKHDGKIIGYKKNLVFYYGKPKNGVKTSWMMHEFRAADHRSRRRLRTTTTHANDMTLDDWVLCRVYEKLERKVEEEEEEDVDVDDTNSGINSNEIDQTAVNKINVNPAAAAAVSDLSNSCMIVGGQDLSNIHHLLDWDLSAACMMQGQVLEMGLVNPQPQPYNLDNINIINLNKQLYGGSGGINDGTVISPPPPLSLDHLLASSDQYCPLNAPHWTTTDANQIMLDQGDWVLFEKDWRLEEDRQQEEDLHHNSEAVVEEVNSTQIDQTAVVDKNINVVNPAAAEEEVVVEESYIDMNNMMQQQQGGGRVEMMGEEDLTTLMMNPQQYCLDHLLLLPPSHNPPHWPVDDFGFPIF